MSSTGYKKNPLTSSLLRALIGLARLQEFKGWDRVNVHVFPQFMPYNAGRSYTSVRAVKDLEALCELGLTKRLKSKTVQIIKKGRTIPDCDYATTKKGDEMIKMLIEAGLPRWQDI